MKRGAERSGEAKKKKKRKRIHSNANLMALLRSPDSTISSKLEQASQYVHGPLEDGGGAFRMQHFISFLAEWIQQAIISGAKAEVSPENAAVDHRSWETLAWCLSNGSSLNIHPGIFKALELALRFKSTSEETLDALLRVLELLLHAYERILRPQLMDWTSLVSSSLEALLLLLKDQLARNDSRRVLLLKISTRVVNGFAKFLATFGNPKLAFQATVEKLLSSAMVLLGISSESNAPELENLQVALRSLLETGIFQTMPLEGFPEVCSSAAKWLGDHPGSELATHSSNHKLLFEKMKQARHQSFSSLSSAGALLRMFIRRFKIHRASLSNDVFGVRGTQEPPEETPEKQETKKNHLSDSQQMFLVFVELALPLLQELQKLSEKKEFSESSGELLASVNGLFMAARDEKIYSPTQDTSSQGHLRFLQLHYNILLNYSKLVSTSKNSGEFQEIITGVSCVLGMEHRAAEDRVQDFWLMLLAAAAALQAREESINKVIQAGCQMLEFMSELRNFSSLSVLFFSLKVSVLQPELMFLSASEHELGVKSFFYHPSFLKALGKIMESLPEAQAPEIIRMVARDAQETLELLGRTPEAITLAGAEIYSHLLESLKITPTNAFQAGARVRELVNAVISEPLRELLGKFSKKKKVFSGIKAYFLLRLFMISRALHRECLTLMAPQKAMKAAEEAHEMNSGSPELDWNSVEAQELSFFSWIEAPGSSTLSKLVSGAREGASPWLVHVLDRLIIHRLRDLRRYTHSLEFFRAKTIACSGEDPVLEAPEVSSDSAGELLASLREEAMELVALLFEGDDLRGELQSRTWNEVFASLNQENFPVARWLLVSRTTDLWSEFATRSELKSFFSVMFYSWENSDQTRELLSNLELYENQVLQSSILRSAWDTLRKLLPGCIKFKSLKKLAESGNWDLISFEEGDSSLTPEALEKSIRLVRVLSSFSSGLQTSTRFIFCMSYLERLLINLLSSKPGTRNETKLLELFAVCRRALHSSFIRSEELCSSMDIDLCRWLRSSIDIISEHFRSSEALLASVIKSTQDIIQLKAKLLFTQESRRLLQVSGDDEAPAPSTSEQHSREFLEFFSEQSRVLIDASRGERSGKLLGSVATTRSLLSSVAGCFETLDKECLENKEKKMKWTPELSEAWSSCLKQAEKGVVAMLLNRVSSSETPELEASGIVEIYTGINELENEEAPENEKHSEDEQDEAEDDEEEDPMSAEDEAHPSSELASGSKLFNTELERGDSELIGELFIAMSSLIKLRSLYFSPNASRRASSKPGAPPSLSFLLGLLEALLLEATSYLHNENSRSLSFFWLYGAVKCLGSIGLLLQTLSASEFRKWVIIHIDLLAAILSLQGSSSELLHEKTEEFSEFFKVDVSGFFRSLRAAVIDSFGALVKFSLRNHLMVALQTIHRGFSGGSGLFKLGSSLSFGDGYGGRVGVVPAAAVECLAVTLDSISGRWRLNAVAKYSPKLVAGLLNLITHLQGPALFIEARRTGDNKTSSVPVILQLLEIVSRVASREVIFQMKPNHVALALHSPVSIMKPVLEFRSSPELKRSYGFPEDKLVMSLFVASCRALCSVLRHRKRESGRCIALLAEALRVLLHCLESSGNKTHPKSYSMELSTAVQCSQWLRRVYEELGEHKESLSRYCTNVLSDYLCVLSGNGPLGGGFEREIDKELRPGVYALLCSSLDLQQLHSALGEGAMRNNLVMMRQEYEKNYKYTGKV